MPINWSIKCRVVIDTNVLVSAFIYGGKPRRVVERWLTGEFVLLMSPGLLAEILMVFRRLNYDEEELEKLKVILESQAVKLAPKREFKLCRDEKDNKVADLCVAGMADYLVTGDKDLLELGVVEKTKVVKASEFLEIFEKW